MSNVIEDKIIFKIDGIVRVLRGIITHEDETFVYIKRRDGNHRINKKDITKIEEGNNAKQQ